VGALWALGCRAARQKLSKDIQYKRFQTTIAEEQKEEQINYKLNLEQHTSLTLGGRYKDR